jgi:hypothetical protein
MFRQSPRRPTRTKADLARHWADRFQISNATTVQLVEEMYGEFLGVLAAGGEVQLRGVGVWKTRARKNGTKVIQFRPSDTLVCAANRTPRQSCCEPFASSTLQLDAA